MQPVILITGGAGYIGSHTAFYLYQKGYEIIIIDNFSHQQKFNPSWAKIIKSDFSNKEILNSIFTKHKVEAVMHFAANIEIENSLKDPIKFYRNNVSKTFDLLDVMLKNHINKFIFSSSCAIYGNPQFLPINEMHPFNPLNPYGKSKLMIENSLNDLTNSTDFKYISLRYFNAAGAIPEQLLGEQHNPETHLIPLLLKSVYKNIPFTIHGIDHETKDGTCIRDFIHVFDIAEAHWLALQHLMNNEPSDCFNLGTGQGYSVKEMIQFSENLFRAKIQVIHTKKREGDAPIFISDSTKAKNILKWIPKYSHLELILRSAYIFANN